MSELAEYVVKNTVRGACRCGRCADAPESPEKHQPNGHTADLVMFEVSASEHADADTLRSLVSEHRGAHCDCDLFDGKEHSYLEVGGWIGDQGLALMLMGLGSLLGLWRLLTPRSVLGDTIPNDLAKQMAGAGMVTIQHAA